MNQELLKLLQDGYSVITPTARLGRYLQYRYAVMQLSAGRRGWQTPDCLPWTAWIQREWQELAQKTGQNQYLVNTLQQDWLWQSIIRQSPGSDRLLQHSATARQAMAAHDLCSEYEIEIFPATQYLNEDALAFRHWADQHRQALQQSGMLDTGSVPGEFCAQVSALDQSRRKCVFYGFDVISPVQQRVINSLREAGADIRVMQAAARNETVSLYAASHVHDEIRQLAGWSQNVLSREPDATIGIICPQLQALRQVFVNHLDVLLTPASLLSLDDTDGKPYNIALGRPLYGTPLVYTALNILRLGQQRIPLAIISQVLLSPFIHGADSELSRRACFDGRLRELGEPALTLKTLFHVAGEQCRPHQQCPQFIDMLKAFDIAFLSNGRKQKAGAWAQSFSYLLQQFHWPGERARSSEEYQTLEAWKDLLGQLASLEHVSGRMTYNQALSCLSRNALETRFQPQTAEAPIQVMGSNAAAGMQFDYLWFMHCHDQAWPPPRQPNPFIPAPLQRAAGIAAAGADAHLQSYRDMTRQIVCSARHAVFSYPQREDDREMRASPLIRIFADNIEVLAGQEPDDYLRQMQSCAALDKFVDDQAPPFQTGQAATGGSGIFKDQALCPFRAFARHRLHARALQSVDSGLSPVDRGLLVHEVMQNFWLHQRDSSSLLQADERQLAKRIDNAVGRALKKFSTQQPETLTENFIRLEHERLVTLLNEWLSLERERAPFTVQEIEQWHPVEFAGMKIHMRIDRIDALMDGRVVIIDYKTGYVNVNDWLDERPGDPQLPLYAVTTSGDVAAIVYGKIRRGECKFQGMAAGDDLLPSVKAADSPGWEEQLQQWQSVLAGLAQEFRAGIATVTPRDSNACNQCDLHGFCRIYERTGFAGAENGA